jgi:predicted ArsR family transcriptional regulator
LQELYTLLAKSKPDEAIALLDSLNISNDMAKEHLMDLCMNKNIKG